MQAPSIDPRGYPDIVAQTQQLAGTLSGWQPAPDGQADAGQALIAVFGRFAELVIDRLNQAPDKQYLAFLNLIGTAPVPPRPARVPLTFQLAAGSPVDAVVPAGSRAAAPAQAAGSGEVVFETEHPLVVTRAQLQAAYAADPRTDTYSDCSAQATGAASQPFGPFTGTQHAPHQLYLACDPLLTQPGSKNIMLTLASADTWQWQQWPVSWAYWDGESWQPIDASPAVQGGGWQVSLPSLPPVIPTAVNGTQAGWLQAQLNLPLPPGRSDQPPDAAATGTSPPQVLALPLAVFPADGSAQQFYLRADEAFGAAGAQVSIQVGLAQDGAGAGVQLTWSYLDDTQWRPLGQSATAAAAAGSGASAGTGSAGTGTGFSDGTLAFTQSGQVSFRAPMSWPLSLYNNLSGRWLQVQASGQYTTGPQISALSVGFDWQLPQVGAVTVAAQPGPAAGPVPPAAAFCNTAVIDLSKDFYPLGQQPQFNDTFYLSCPTALASPGAAVTLSFTLTNPPGSQPAPPVPAVNLADSPALTWEASDGSQWHPAGAAYAFGANAAVSLTLPDPLAPSVVNGQQGYWLRARLTGGDYGKPAGYQQGSSSSSSSSSGSGSSFTFQPSTLAPPVVKTVQVTATTAEQAPVPVTGCLSYNDFGYTDQTAAAGPGTAGPFAPFTPTADTDPALYLGFDQPFSLQPVTLFLTVPPPQPEQVAAAQLAGPGAAPAVQTTWEYAGPAGWQPLGATDETQALSGPGLVTFPGPADLAPQSRFGQELCWLRLRWQSGTFPLPPLLGQVLPGTTWAAQVTTVPDEILGSASGNPGQTFTAAQAPVQPGQQLVVREPQLPVPAEEQALAQVEGPGAVTVVPGAAGQPEQIWVRWHAVPDFYASGPRDRHYTADPMSGRIGFGDGTNGMIPPQGQGNIRMTYNAGGGEQGNVAAAAVAELKSSIPYVAGVTNHQPAQGGAPAEPIDQVQARGPLVLRHRDRAVAAQDLVDLAAAASADVAVAAAVTPVFDPLSLWTDPAAPAAIPGGPPAGAGQMGVIIVPAAAGPDRPVPGLGLLGQVRDYLAERCPPTAQVWVAGPEWIAVTVTATVVVTSLAAADAAGDQARAALAAYLEPLTGGPGGQGWAFGQWPHPSQLSALLEQLPGVDHVGSLTVDYQPETEDLQIKDDLSGTGSPPGLFYRTLPPDPGWPAPAAPSQGWLDRALVYSGPHDISVALP